MSEKVQLDLDLLLPDIPDEKDQCVDRLQRLGQEQKGIDQIHLDHKNGKAVLCIHYDTRYLTLSQVERMMQQTGARLSQRYQHETLHITDMDCANCASSIEHIVGRVDGVLDVVVNYPAERLRVEYDSRKLHHAKIIKLINALGYQIEEPEKPKSAWQRHWELVLSILSGLFLLAGFFLENVFHQPLQVYLPFYLLAYGAGGYDASRHGLKAAMRLKFDVDFLMVVAAIGAAVLGKWSEGALLLFLFSLGHSLEHAAMEKARRAIKALAGLTPKTARVRRDGAESEIPVENVQRGDVVILRPGERVPIDGKIIKGVSEFDESPITGESIPKLKQQGDTVFAGTINTDNAVEIEVTKLASDTTLARIIKLVEEAQTQKSPSQRFTQNLTRIFVPATLGTVLLVMLAPPLLHWLSWDVAFFRAMTMLVAASPCALAIATPAAILSGIAQAARNGVLVKGGVHLENLGVIRAMAFDKTGTITYGQPRVTDVVPLNEFTESQVIRIAASFESRSQHPVARAIVDYARQQKIDLFEPEDVISHTGKGITGRFGQNTVQLGNRKIFDASDPLPALIAQQLEAMEEQGKTTVILKQNDEYIGLIALADQAREKAASTLRRLKALGVKALVMLTGDNARVAESISRQVGFTRVEAELMPEDKVRTVKQLQAQFGRVAMVGDGVNDAPAMAAATVGIAMGSAGTDVALETADVALMSDALEQIPFTVGLSRQARKIILQNMVIALGVISLLLPSAMFGLATIGIAIVFHEGSTLLVVVNALRLLKYRAQ